MGVRSFVGRLGRLARTGKATNKAGNSIRILTLLTIGLLLLGETLYFILPEKYEYEVFSMAPLAAGVWSFIALLVALVIRAIKDDNK